MRKKEEREKGRCSMKKLLLILVVAAISAPLYAAGGITFVATDNTDGTCTVTFTATDPCIPPVAMGLNVKVNGDSDPCHLITAVDGMNSFFEIYMDYAYDDPCSYTYGAGNPVADPCAAGSASLPSYNFCISMGGLGGETDPDEKPAPTSGTAFVLTAGNLTDPCDPVTGTISLNALRGGVIGTDTEPMTTNLTIPFTISYVPETECMAATNPDYATWVAEGSPSCWCYERQCNGDAKGDTQFGLWPVYSNDLTVFVSAFAQTVLPPGGICADFCRDKAFGLWRVYSTDLAVFVANFAQTVVAPCSGPGCDIGCGAACDSAALPNTHYNFWCTPATCPLP